MFLNKYYYVCYQDLVILNMVSSYFTTKFGTIS